jgi:hypothetical protein
MVWDGIFIHVSMHGFSRHLWDVRASEVHHLAYVSLVSQVFMVCHDVDHGWQMNYLAEISSAPTMLAAKCSILFQLKRLFCPGPSRTSVFWSLHALLFINAAYYTSAIFTFVFQCTPREKTWNALMDGQCINVAAATIAGAAVNLLVDIGILVTPLWAVWSLQLPMKRKLGVMAIFGVGILYVSPPLIPFLSPRVYPSTNKQIRTCAIAAVGVVLRIPLLTDPDLTWIITKVGVWT